MYPGSFDKHLEGIPGIQILSASWVYNKVYMSL